MPENYISVAYTLAYEGRVRGVGEMSLQQQAIDQCLVQNCTRLSRGYALTSNVRRLFG